MKKQGYNDRLDESLGERDGKESTKKQSYKDRRDESRAEKKLWEDREGDNVFRHKKHHFNEFEEAPHLASNISSKEIAFEEMLD